MVRKALVLAAVAAAAVPSSAAAADRYALAGGCYAIEGIQGAEQVRMQATALGQYLLYRPDRMFVTADLATAAEPSPAAEWEVQDAGGGGPSFVQVTSFGTGCPDDRTLLLGSQRSQHSGWDRSHEQVELYAAKQWVDPPFCADELAAAPKESVTRLDHRGVVKPKR